MFSDKQIEEFREIYKKEFGESISADQARVLATQLISLIRVVYQPYKTEDLPEKTKTS